MSTDFTHFDKLSFSTLFSRGPDGAEITVVNSAGALFVTGLSVGTAAISVGSINALAATNQAVFGPTSALRVTLSIPAPTGSNRTASFPSLTANDTVVFAAQAQTLTNKTISGSSNTLSNIGDASLSTSYLKADGSRALTASWNAGAFSVTHNGVVIGSAASKISGLTTIINGSGILTLPTSSDTILGRATTDTLTNKSIDGGSNTLANIGDGSLSTSYVKADGSRALTADWNVGAFKLSATTFSSRTANAASAGVIRLANADAIKFRNSGNSGDISLAVGSSDTVASYAGLDLVNVSGSQTLTNKTLTSPAINTPTGIVKGDVGLGSVDNTSDATKNAASVTLTNKTISGASNTLSSIPMSALTVQYWDGYTGGSNAKWTTTSNTYGDGTNSNGNTVTQRQGSGITVTAGASNVAGITFTPASSAAVYWVSASFCSQNNGANSNSYRLTDGAVVVKEAQGFGTGTVRFTMNGIYVPGTGSAITLKIQIATSGGTLTIDDEGVSGLAGKTIEWVVKRIF